MESNKLKDLLIKLLDIVDEDKAIVCSFLKRNSINSFFEDFHTLLLTDESYMKIQALKDIILLIVEDI